MSKLSQIHAYYRKLLQGCMADVFSATSLRPGVLDSQCIPSDGSTTGIRRPQRSFPNKVHWMQDYLSRRYL